MPPSYLSGRAKTEIACHKSKYAADEKPVCSAV
jgi:hypothetical protein